MPQWMGRSCRHDRHRQLFEMAMSWRAGICMQPPRVRDVHLGTPRSSVYSYTSTILIGWESYHNFPYRLIGLVNKTVHPHHLESRHFDPLLNHHRTIVQ
jgi:hypothetical protein